jgi:hypothetical protein
MKSRGGPITLIVAGGLLALGPLWGILGTVIGMIRAFGMVASPGAGAPERLASGINASLWATWAGLATAPIGLGLLTGGFVWLGRARKAQQSIEPEPPPSPVPAPAPYSSCPPSGLPQSWQNRMGRQGHIAL